MAYLIDITDKKFGKLLVIKKLEGRGPSGQVYWECLCDCGNTHVTSGECLRSGKTKSCGCMQLIPHNKNENRIEALFKHLFNCTVIKRNKKFGVVNDIYYELFKELALSNCYYC